MGNLEQQAARIGAQVRRARKAHGWTIQELADAAGVAPNTANAVELGRKTRPGNLRAVLDAVGLPADLPGEQQTDSGTQLALDVVQKWLEALPPEERAEAVQRLVRFVMLDD